MDPNLNTLNQNVQNTGSDVAKLTESIPGLLSGLKSNLTSIFTKDNPMFGARENAMTTFLNQPSQTRTELLGQGLSPTQQESIVQGRSNAAMVPLAGLNQSIVGQYGNLADMLQSAGGLYQSQLGGLQQRANMAQQLYQNAVNEAKQAEAIRQFNVQESRLGASSAGMGDLSSLIEAMFGNQPEVDPAQFDIPDQPSIPGAGPVQTASRPIEIPGQGVVQSYTPTPIASASPGRWNPFDQFGALGELLFGGQRNQPIQNMATSMNLLPTGA